MTDQSTDERSGEVAYFISLAVTVIGLLLWDSRIVALGFAGMVLGMLIDYSVSKNAV